jgi:hypothetical protein
MYKWYTFQFRGVLKSFEASSEAQSWTDAVWYGKYFRAKPELVSIDWQ